LNTPHDSTPIADNKKAKQEAWLISL